MYALNHYAYCGMTIPLGTGGYREMRAKAKEVLARRKRQGFETVPLARNEWEVLCPDTAWMVPDQCGIMTIERISGEDN